MRILVYGAGVLGCNLARSFYVSKKNVTLLARGEWYKEIKENGLTIQHRFTVHKTNDRIKVIDTLDSEDVYDVIFVTMQSNQLEPIIDILNKNKSKNIVLVGNNICAEKFKDLLRDKNILFGFFSAAGKRENGIVKSFCLNKMTLGRMDGTSESDALIGELFNGTKIKVTVQNRMNEWLKSHAAFILPFVYAAYYAECDYRKIKQDKVLLNKVIDAARQYYDVLKALGYEILPEGDYEFVSTERWKCYLFLKLCCYTSLGDICICDHAKNGIKEMKALSEDFIALKKKANVITLAADELEKYMPC